MTWRQAESYRRRRYSPRPRSLFRQLLDYVLAAAILGLLALVSARLDRVATRQVAGEAVINDGDSITLKGERIRLRGIDAPEYMQTCEKNGVIYPCGHRSREALAGLAKGGPVKCAGWERDRYGRLLATCTAGGIELNRRQVEEGWAVAYGNYVDAEDSAPERGLGLWAGSFERPRDWRAEHGDMSEVDSGALGSIFNWLKAIFGFS